VNKCVKSENDKKLVKRHIEEEYLEEANHFRYDSYVKSVYNMN
jgi:hypothetical protein